jgi:hypothetical protein
MIAESNATDYGMFRSISVNAGLSPEDFDWVGRPVAGRMNAPVTGMTGAGNEQ